MVKKAFASGLSRFGGLNLPETLMRRDVGV
jgi:hypothetical protein